MRIETGYDGSMDTDEAWILRSEALTCETNDDYLTVSVLSDSLEQSLQDCFRTCEQHPDCVAVDWFTGSRKCNLFPRACTEPTFGARPSEARGVSYVMAQDPMKAKACASWNETMAFVGEGWRSTDVNPQEIVDVLQQAFSRCRPEDAVTVFIAEQDVGYSRGSGLSTALMNTMLMTFNNEHKLFHSGIRFTGCGTSVMFQLQTRTWGLSNGGAVGTTAFGATLQYPVTSPDGHTMWNELMCDVPGRGMRDVGGGNIVYYKVEEERHITRWVRGEHPISHLRVAHIEEFMSGISRYFSWWNIKSRYFPEAVYWRGADGATTKLREQVTCDTFTLWMASQLIAFQVAHDYPDQFQQNHWEGVHFNHVDVTLSDDNSDDGPAPVRGDLSELNAREDQYYADMEDCLVRAWSMTNKQTSNAIWSTIKGAGICWDVPEDRRQDMLDRDWRDPSSHTAHFNRYTFLHGRNPLDLRFYCTDRVRIGHQGGDLVGFGLWRFFYVGGGNYAGGMDWDVQVEGSYDNYRVYNLETRKVYIPGGTPTGPWHEGAESQPCGTECPWEYPVPDPGEAGFRG